ncbi:retrovirus-related pol polyprotein from transposon TNT 1-94 [Tanacetum coccineum]
MLAISQFPIKVAEPMAKMVLKEAQGLWMAWIYSLKSLTKETQEEEAEDIDYSKSENHSHEPKAEDKVQGALDATEFVSQTLGSYYENVGITHQTLVARTPQQNDVVERRNQTLVEASRTMLIFSKAPLFLWTEAVATACYTQNRSLIRTRHNKTPYELMHDRKPDLRHLHVFGALCYPTKDSEDLGMLKPKADIGIFVGYSPTKNAYRIYNKKTRIIIETIHVEFDELTVMASEQFNSGPAPQFMTPGYISSGLVQNPSSSTPNVPPSKKYWDILFQPLFDEYFNPTPCVVSPMLPADVPIPANTTSTPSSTTMDQDAPSASTSPTNQEIQALVIHQGVKEQIQGIQSAEFDNAPLIYNLTPGPSSEESSSQGVISSDLHLLNQSFDNLKVNYKPMPYGATLMYMDIRYHLVENGLVEIYSVKRLTEEEEEYWWKLFMWLRLGKKELNGNIRIMPTKDELALEQSQQGASDDVLVSIEGFEE